MLRDEDVRIISQGWIDESTKTGGLDPDGETEYFSIIFDMIFESPHDYWRVIESIFDNELSDWNIEHLSCGLLEIFIANNGNAFSCKISNLILQNANFSKAMQIYSGSSLH